MFGKDLQRSKIDQTNAYCIPSIYNGINSLCRFIIKFDARINEKEGKERSGIRKENCLTLSDYIKLKKK